MSEREDRTVVVTGATGLQGGAVTRRLLKEGWRVRALTRNPGGKEAQALNALGADVARADMNNAASLRRALAGAYGVYSVQNPYIGGPEKEVAQGKNVADAAKEAGVSHFIYGSAGIGRAGTGVPSWETKLRVEAHLKALALPLTIFRPMAFMELMTDKKFFPQASTWRLMPALMGASRPVGWLCTEDLGAIVANAFAAPHEFVGKEFSLASDVQTLDQCRAHFRDVMGKNPPSFPMPLWLFRRFGFVGQDLTTMWGWLRSGALDLDTAPTRALHPDALTVREWLTR